MAPGHVLEGCLQVQSDQNAGLLHFRKALDVFDHLVSSILATHSVLYWACSSHDRWFFSRDDRFERKSPQERHHEKRSVSICEFCMRRDLSGAKVLEDSIRE